MKTLPFPNLSVRMNISDSGISLQAFGDAKPLHLIFAGSQVDLQIVCQLAVRLGQAKVRLTWAL